MTIAVIGEDWSDICPQALSLPNLNRITARQPGARLELWVNGQGWEEISGVVWRTACEEGGRQERALLEMIDGAGIGCVNSASCMLNFSSRLRSLSVLGRAGFPVLERIAVLGRCGLHLTPFELPAVVKIGNHHAGFGKILVRSDEVLQDVGDIAGVADDFVTIEPFWPYLEDHRVLVVGSTVLGFQRRATSWKANCNPDSLTEFRVDDALAEEALRAATTLGAAVLGLDYLIGKNRERILLEANLNPGLVDLAGRALHGGEVHRTILELATRAA